MAQCKIDASMEENREASILEESKALAECQELPASEEATKEHHVTEVQEPEAQVTEATCTAADEEEEQRRIDPEDGQAVTFGEYEDKHAELDDVELHEYFYNHCELAPSTMSKVQEPEAQVTEATCTAADEAHEPEAQVTEAACTAADEVQDTEVEVMEAACAASETPDDDFASVSSDVEQDDEVNDARENFVSLGEQPEGDEPQPAAEDAHEGENADVCAEPTKLDAEVMESVDDAMASETTDGTAAGDAQVDTDATNSDSDTTAAPRQESQETAEARTEGRILHVQATLPQDLSFVVPPGCVPGQILTVRGPHGPLHVQAPPGMKAGQKCAVRLAPPFQHEVFVPAGAKPGQKVTFLGEDDEQLEAIVPPGKLPGQVFHVSPPVVMVPVPTELMKGDRLSFTTPNGQVLVAEVPDNLSPGQYFSVRY